MLKQLARDVLPHEVIDRPKGYFPVPPLVAPRRPRRRADCASARPRPRPGPGLFRPEHVEHLLDHPAELTTLRYNKLWELGMLELWLQIPWHLKGGREMAGVSPHA